MLERVIVIVGEPSGDKLGAQLALELRKLNPNIEIEGIFGAEMIRAGCLQLASMDTLSVMGLIDPLLSLNKILKLRKWILRYILENPPDLLIAIDSPDFNLSVEKIVRKAGIRTVHYVSPSVWAWRQGRIKTIQKSVDLMLTLFPFEADFYRQHKVPVEFVGHPAADRIDIDIDVIAAKQELGYRAEDELLAVLPGSRNSELKNMVPVYLNTIKLCHAQKPHLKFVIPVLYSGHQAYIEHWRKKLIPAINIQYVIANTDIVLQAADCVLVTSGTASLEVMLHKKPMIVAYKTNWLTYQIVKRLIKVKYIALPNLLANTLLVPEFIQSHATAKNLAKALLDLLGSKSLQAKQLERFAKLQLELRQGASQKAAAAIWSL